MMSQKTFLPLYEYIKAFAQYTPGNGRVFHTKPFGRHALINDSVNIYQVSHFEDMVAEYKSFFGGDFGLLFTEFPAELWEVLLPKVIAPIMDDFIIELYRSWQLFGEHQSNLFENTAKYNEAKEASYQDFQQLVETINTGPGDIITKAADLDEINLLPVIALTIRALYSSPKDFYKDCVRVMTSVFFDQIGDGDFFVRVGPDQMPMPEDQIFYIYTVDVDF